MLMIVNMAIGQEYTCYDVTSDNWCATQPRGYIGNLEQLHSTPLQTARTLQQSTKYINAKQAKHKRAVQCKNLFGSTVHCVHTNHRGRAKHFSRNEIKNLTFVQIVFPRFAEQICRDRDFNKSLKKVFLQFTSSQTRNI